MEDKTIQVPQTGCTDAEEQIKVLTGLKKCSEIDEKDCKGCPYQKALRCGKRLKEDAIGLIMRLNEQAREADAMKKTVEGMKGIPKHVTIPDSNPVAGDAFVAVILDRMRDTHTRIRWTRDGEYTEVELWTDFGDH